ncbi:hypothetical protein C8F04DRAFT_213114 [Mycena alexandri]|uniref:Uncharacterized protein n=1 Tax=Mycena alexandri TaxID=1745969 RepID=A0AAD6THV1_9AGAR|nr:hypothetical protein C8F04DRAFT_745924 [Mycena alexandri]KAJ7046891.1 hypothetical protein C8F04DRAFT_213114 [Mycena alexandri]
MAPVSSSRLLPTLSSPCCTPHAVESTRTGSKVRYSALLRAQEYTFSSSASSDCQHLPEASAPTLNSADGRKRRERGKRGAGGPEVCLPFLHMYRDDLTDARFSTRASAFRFLVCLLVQIVFTSTDTLSRFVLFTHVPASRAHWLDRPSRHYDERVGIRGARGRQWESGDGKQDAWVRIGGARGCDWEERGSG